jgi:hypothetical protein
VTPSTLMTDSYDSWSIAVVEPQPPEHLLRQTMDQVHNFLLDRGLEIVNSLPWFFGAGAFQFRNPLVSSSLITHEPWPFGDGSTLKFIRHNEGVGFRTHQGARSGW